MARLSESPAASSSQPGTKRSISLKNGFLASATKPSGSQSPHPNKRLKSLATTAGSPTPADEPPRSQSPSSQRPSSSQAAPLSSPSLPKPFGDTFADEMDMAGIRASGDSVIAAMSAQPDDDSTPANTAPTAFMGPSIDVAQMSTPTPEPVVPKATSVVSSVKQSVSNVFSGFGASRNGTATANAFTTFEQTIASRKRSREPESEETPASSEKESEKEEADAEAGNVTAEVNDTTIQLGNQFEAEAAADEERAKSPVKEAVEVAAPTASPTDGGEINVTTIPPENADTIEAESTETAEPAAAATASAVEDEDEDEDMADDPTNGLFVIEEIYGHRRDPKDKTLFQMHVRWKHDVPSWEPESNIQEDAEDLLFAYWDSVKGGRRAHMADKGLWHALKVEKHRQKAHGVVEVQVAWVGSRDRSWEPEDQVQQYARELLEDYWVAKGGREKHVRAIAVPAKRGRGRPRKDAASEAPSTEAEAEKEPAKAVKEPVKAPVKANSRAVRKKAPVVGEAPEPAAEPAAEESKAAEAAPADEEEPPRKRGRGRPRKSVP
ncbi:chromo domain-containing protein [Colletotrichum musicola]|uniref:Chromo domain-containing protein n=1 Tax=Colletotrichum musicola TaxID=2175873 RepID=A0A8H6NCN4_9PEZI|nr:chromo domain-containing protein [Colletotrichum musicola]